jgi:hypothetical protein
MIVKKRLLAYSRFVFPFHKFEKLWACLYGICFFLRFIVLYFETVIFVKMGVNDFTAVPTRFFLKRLESKSLSI